LAVLPLLFRGESGNQVIAMKIKHCRTEVEEQYWLILSAIDVQEGVYERLGVVR
jgi:hypothetical protein